MAAQRFGLILQTPGDGAKLRACSAQEQLYLTDGFGIFSCTSPSFNSGLAWLDLKVFVSLS